MLVPIGHSWEFGMVFSVMSVVLVVKDRNVFLGVEHHVEGSLVFGSDAQVDCAGSFGLSKNPVSVRQVICELDDVSQDVGPWLTESSGWSAALRGNPDLLSDCYLFRDACEDADQAQIADVRVLLRPLFRRVIHRYQSVFVYRKILVPVQSPHVQSHVVFCGWTPDAQNCAGGLNQLRENVDVKNFLMVDAGGLGDAASFFEDPAVGVLASDENVESEDLFEKRLGSGSEGLFEIRRNINRILQFALEVLVEDVELLFELGSEELSVGEPHLVGAALHSGDEQSVGEVCEGVELSVLDSLDELGLLLDEGLVVETVVAGPCEGGDRQNNHIYNKHSTSNL